MNTLTIRFLMIVSLAFGVLACGSDTAADGAVVNGNVKNANGDLIYLEDVNGNMPVAVDTATVENGKVKLSAEVKPGIYRIRMDNVNSKTPTLFFLDEESKIKFTFNKDEPDFYTASGNKETEVINKALSEQAALFEEVESIRKEFSNSPDKIDSLNQLMQKKYAEASEKVKETITSSRDLNPHVNTLLLNLLSPQTEGKFIAEELKLALEKDSESRFIKAMGQRFGLITNPQAPQPRKPTGIAVGEKAPAISQANPKGKEMALSDLEGKYVLIDFWASWCKPCRFENPNVVKTYKKYKDKGFEVFSVSLDKSKDRWVKAIEDDGLVWDGHVSDLKAWSNEAARAYGVGSIPATFLIDPEGNVIAKNLRGPALENKLAEVLGGV